MPMKFRPNDRSRSGSLVVIGPIVAAMALVMVIDTVTDYAIAAAVFYTAIILFAARLMTARMVVLLAFACVVLTVTSFLLTHSGAYEVGLINTGISIVAIGVTTYLALRLVAAEASAFEARERLLRVARVTSLGELTASIAHEVNQPLAAVVTSANACTRWLAQDPPGMDNARRALERVVKEANRASEVIARVRGLTSGKAPERSRLDFNDAVREIVDLAQGQISTHQIALTMRLDETAPAVIADRIQIGQVVGNLLLNAIEAIVASPGSRRELEISTEVDGHERVRFSITDSGVGFPPGVAEHLFDAFWTTKTDGIGLGLTISRSIIEANGGTIWAEASEAGGAVFSFDLPFAKGKAE
ncbi:MAG TPA: ATP-binding protein [Xanthobacteraceae bacterium]|nr:ATP-binding protein [Xanthobacteraceae bacterium]